METKSDVLLQVEQATEKAWEKISCPNGYADSVNPVSMENSVPGGPSGITSFKEAAAPLIVKALDTPEEALAAIDILFAQMPDRHDGAGSSFDPHCWDYQINNTYYDAAPAMALAQDSKKLKELVAQMFAAHSAQSA